MKILSLPTSREMPGKFEDLVRMYPPRAVRDEVDYENLQVIIDRLTSIPRLTRGQAEYLDTLTVLFEAYEREHYPIKTSDLSGIDALKHILEQNEMAAADLGRLLGDRSLGTRILSRERELSKAHIRKLCRRSNVSADLFLPSTRGSPAPRSRARR